MSKTIDEKVVEMKFNNKDFENNVSDTLKSLDKLKQSLKLPESSKALENISHSLSKIDTSNLSKGLDSVKERFSALEVVGVTALVNITNSAVNAGKKILSALTIDPVKTGFEEYELKMESVRTIMASTGENIETVNKYLDELNTYSDRTIYKFSDMTQNIGKFTNAGVKLEDAVIAMKGLSNEAAVSGANTNEAARAMYNFAQALSMGYVQLIDWKSIENANMATVEFKQNLLDTAVELKTVTKTSDGLYKSGKKSYNLQAMFKDGLKDQWLTTEVLLKTLKDYGDENTEIGKKAYAAAQDVSKFTQMWDVLKETAQSGWAKTWETLVGDMNKAKAIFTPLTKFFSDIIDSISDARNALLETALAKNFKSLFDSVKTAADGVKELVKSAEDYKNVVDSIIKGNYGNGQLRWNKLTEEGYDWAHAQNLVNERLGNSVRHATDYTEAQSKLIDTQGNSIESISDYIVALSELSDEELRNNGLTEEQISSLRALQNASEKTGIELKYLIDNIDEIDGRFLLLNSFKNIGNSLFKVFKSIGTAWRDAFPPMTADTLFDIIAGFHKFSTIISSYVENNIDNLTRTLKGLFAILDIITTFVGGGFKIAFMIFKGVLEGLGYNFGNVLELTAYLGDKLTKLRDIINGGIIKAVSKLTQKIAKAFSIFRNSFNNTDGTFEWIENISLALEKFSQKVSDFVNNSPLLQNIISKLSDGFGKIKDSIGNIDIEKIKEIGKNILEGLFEGLGSGVKKVINFIMDIGRKIIDAFCQVLGIASPSKEFFTIGSYIIQGLVNGLSDGNTKIINTITSLGNKLKEVFEKINIGRWLSILTDAIITHIAPKRLVAAYGLAKTLLSGFGVYMFNIFETIQNGASNADFIINSITKIKDSFKSLFSDIATWFTGIKDAENPAIYIIQGLANGIKNGFAIVSSAILSLAKIIILTIENALDIHSPSKVFFAIGGFIVLGLVAGMKDKLGFVTDGIKGLADTLVNTFKQIDFGKIFAAGLAVGLLYTANSIIKTINAITGVVGNIISPLKAFSNMLNSIGSGIKQYYSDKGQAEKIKAIGGAVKDFAISIAILAGSIWLLSKIEYSTDMWKLFGYLSAIVGVMIVLAAAMAFVNKIPSKNSGKITESIIQISASIFVLSLAMNKLGNMNPEQLAQSLSALAKVLIGLAAYMIAYGKFVKGDSAKNMDKASKLMLGLSISLLIMSKVLKTLSGMSEDNLKKSIKAIFFIEAIFAALMVISKYAGENINKVGLSMILMAFALKTMVKVVKTASQLDIKEVLNGIICLGMIELLFLALIKISSIAGENASKAGSMILQISFAFLILIGVIKLVSKLSMEEVTKGIVFIGAVGILFGALIAVSHFAGKEAIKAGTMLLEASISLLLIAGVLFLLTKMDQDKLWDALGIVAVLEAMFAVLIGVSHFAGNATKTITAIAVALSVLVVGLIALSFIDSKKLMLSVEALTAVILALTILIASTALVNKSGVGLASIIVLSLVVAGLVGLLFLLGNLETEGLLEKVKALSLLLGTMAITLGVLTLVGLAGPAALVGIGILATLATALGIALAAFGALNKDGKLEDLLNNGIPVLEKVAYAIGSFVGNLIKGFAESVLSILPYMATQLSLFMINLTPFIVGAKMIDSSVLEGVGYLSAAIIALSVAELINGVTELLTFGSNLSDLGTRLSNFMLNCLPFIMISNTINPDAIDGVKTLVEAILLLSAANIIDGISNLFNLFKSESDANSFTEKMSMFGKGLVAFANEVQGIKDISKIKDAAEAAKMLVSIANELPNEGGLVSLITGDNDLGAFAEKLKPFGEGLVAYGNAVENIKLNSIEESVKAAQAIIDMAKTIPNEGGWLASIVGDNGIAAFGNSLPMFGGGLLLYSDAVKDIDVKDVKNSVEAAQAIIDMAKTIPNEGGWLASIVGDNGIGAFGTKLAPFGKGLKEYGDSVTDLSVDDIEKSEGAFETIIRIFNSIPKDTILNNPLDFNQRTNNSTFITPLINIMNSIKEYSNSIEGINFSSLEQSENAISTLKRILNSLNDINTEGTDVFAAAIDTLAYVSISEFIETWQNSFVEFYDIGYEVINNMKLGIEANQLMLLSLISTLITNTLQKFNGSKIQFYNMGIALIDLLANGMKIRTPMAYNIVISLMNKIIEKLKAYRNDFHQCGVNLGQGLIDGINSMRQLVYLAAFSLGQEAVRGMQEGLDSHSPSRETYKLGLFAGDGLILGINSKENDVAKAANSMGKSIVDNISTALNLANEILNDESSDNLTIRPILDLSEITSGAETISGLLNMSPSIGVMSNLGAISHSMNGKIQNGTNNDIIDSINELRKDISGLQTNSVIIDGITYNDDSNIANAVETLVDAITTERRT